MKYKSLFLFTILFTLVVFTPQIFAFGKNKVQYEQLEWKYHKLPHFNSYFHSTQDSLSRTTAQWIENAYTVLSKQFNFTHRKKIPLIVFKSPTLFEQTNITQGIIPEGVGGFTESMKNRIVVPFTGSYREYRHVLHHELVHAFQFGILFGQVGGFLLRNTGIHMPLWFAEGSAEFLSSGWDNEADMFIMDRVINSSLPNPGPKMGGYLVYKAGQSFLFYLYESYGDSLFTLFLNNFTLTHSVNSALELTYKKKVNALGDDWQQELKRIYWPEIGHRKKIKTIGSPITNNKKDHSFFNLKPRISPNGKYIAYYSDKYDYTRIFICTSKGDRLFSISQYTNGGFFESFQPFRAGLCWSPDSKNIAFITKNKGENELRIFSVNDKKIIRTIPLQLAAAWAPDWSHDGKNIVLCGLTHDRSDIFLYTLDNDTLKRLTNNVQYESSPRFSPDGLGVIFSQSDTSGIATQFLNNKTPQSDVFYISLSNSITTQITKTTYNESDPCISPDGKFIVYVSDMNGIKNIYISPFNSSDTIDTIFAITDIIGGCSSPDWNSHNNTVVFTAFQNQAWNIWSVDSIMTKATCSLPKLTTWQKYRNGTQKYFFAPTTIQQDTNSSQDSLKSYSRRSTFSQRRNKETISETIIEDSIASPKHDSNTTTFLGQNSFYKNPYRTKFTVDFVSLGMAYNAFYGVSGQSIFVFSDLLGNHQIGVAANIQTSLDEMKIFTSYLNTKFRMDFGITFFIERYFTYATPYNDFIYHDTSIGGMLLFRYPFSLFARFDLSFFYRTLSRDPYIFEDGKLTPMKTEKKSKVDIFMPSAIYVFDNILWGLTGPLNGFRGKIKATILPELDRADASFFSLDTDFRSYLHIAKKFVWANRLTVGFSQKIGDKENTRMYLLGGTSNWLYGGLNESEYTRNFYNTPYSSIIVPFRGWNYFDLSGTRYAVFNTEFRFPFVREIALAWPLPLQIKYINGALFADIGNVWNPEEEYKHLPIPKKILGGIGMGMRANLGIFILRYDIAWKTDLNSYVKDAMHYISLGAEF